MEKDCSWSTPFGRLVTIPQGHHNKNSRKHEKTALNIYVHMDWKRNLKVTYVTAVIGAIGNSTLVFPYRL